MLDLCVLLWPYIGKLEILLRECKRLPEDSCKKLLQQLLAQHNSKLSFLLNFLMLRAWKAKTVDCSDIKLKTLLVDKKITDLSLLKSFLESGVAVKDDEISIAIQCLSRSDIAAFKLIVSKHLALDVNEMCSKAFSANKTAFVLHFVDLGAKLPENSDGLFYEALKIKDFDGAKVLVKLFSKKQLSSLELGTLLDKTNLIMNVELAKVLVNAGVSLSRKKSPIVSVMEQSYTCGLRPSDQIELISCFLEHGVDCKDLCITAKKTTTPLHVATDLALKSGESMNIQHYIYVLMFRGEVIL